MSKGPVYLCPQPFSRMNLYFFKPVGSANCTQGFASGKPCVVKEIYATIGTYVHTAAFEVPGIGRTLAFLQDRQGMLGSSGQAKVSSVQRPADASSLTKSCILYLNGPIVFETWRGSWLQDKIANSPSLDEITCRGISQRQTDERIHRVEQMEDSSFCIELCNAHLF